MTVETRAQRVLYQGNGAATEFPFDFAVYAADQVRVVTADAAGAETDRAYGAEFSVRLGGAGVGGYAGGTVVYPLAGPPLGPGEKIAVLSAVPSTQDKSFPNNTPYFQEQIEGGLDKATRLIQQLEEDVARSIKVPPTSAESPEEMGAELLNARDVAVRAAEDAQGAQAGAEAARDEAREEVGRAKAEADRAAQEADRAAQSAQLGAGAVNLDAVWALESGIPVGGVLDLPLVYWPGRNMLHLSYDGVELYRGPQYQEMGEPGEDVRSSSVKMLIPLAAGTVMHAWAVASNVARHVEEAEKAAGDAARKARKEADRAEAGAGQARDAAADAAEEVSQRLTAATLAQANRAAAEAERARRAADEAETAVRDAADEAVTTTKGYAEQAGEQAVRAERQAGCARTEADRARDEAERAAGAATLGVGAANLEATWALEADVAAGGVLTLPDGMVYFPGRNMLRLSHDGLGMYPGVQFEEMDEGRETSGRVRVWLRLKAGAVMNAWIVASNVARHVEAAGAAAQSAANRAEEARDKAESAAKDAAVARSVAQNAAISAGEDAERADKAASDAEKAALVAQAAERKQGIYAVCGTDCLPHCPEGFYIVAPDLAVGGTDSLPLVPVERVEDIPAADGFYLLAAIPPLPAEPEEPEKPDDPDTPGDGEPCCGRRQSLLR